MTKLSDLYDEQNLSNLPKIEESLFRLLWHDDYWDGPQSGMLFYQDRKCWFQVFNESDGSDYYRKFAVIELTEAQLNEEEYWHQLFREKVGTHTDYDESGKRAAGGLMPRKMWPEFYDAYKNRKPQDFSNNSVIGWFER